MCWVSPNWVLVFGTRVNVTTFKTFVTSLVIQMYP